MGAAQQSARRLFSGLAALDISASRPDTSVRILGAPMPSAPGAAVFQTTFTEPWPNGPVPRSITLRA